MLNELACTTVYLAHLFKKPSLLLTHVIEHQLFFPHIFTPLKYCTQDEFLKKINLQNGQQES